MTSRNALRPPAKPGVVILTGGLVLVFALAGCTSASDAPAAPAAASTATSPGTSQPASSSGAPLVVNGPVGVGAVPVTANAGYADAVATFGTDQVDAAVVADAEIARIALADCTRWTTGRVDPRLTALVAPKYLALVKQQMDRPYGSDVPPSLLGALPTDDGNGHDEARAVKQGCDGSGPLHFGGMGPEEVQVDRSGGEPALEIFGSYGLNLTFGALMVGAGQDWTFTSRQAGAGWQLTGASVDAFVDWSPPYAS